MKKLIHHLRPIKFSVYLKPERGQTRCIASGLSLDHAWRRIEECQGRDMGKAWMAPY